VNRIAKKFQELKSQNQCAFVAYICAGDPDYSTSLSCLKNLEKNGVDIIEIGVPFLDPAGDGPTIEMAGKRSIAGGMDLRKTLKMVAEYRQENSTTPIILMSYYNPILKFGLDKIFFEAKKSGVDGFLIVDLPPEEEHEIIAEITKNNLDLIRLIAPTTSLERAKKNS
jgi:tryptophan synthase alpha chain